MNSYLESHIIKILHNHSYSLCHKTRWKFT